MSRRVLTVSAWQLEPPPKLREEVLDLPIVGTSRYFVSSAARRYYLSAGEDVGLETVAYAPPNSIRGRQKIRGCISDRGAAAEQKQDGDD